MLKIIRTHINLYPDILISSEQNDLRQILLIMGLSMIVSSTYLRIEMKGVKFASVTVV